MDALDRLAGPAHDLLSRVDGMLAWAGAPDDHPLWPLLRRLRVLPGDAVAAVAALHAAPLAAAGSALRTLSNQYAQPAATPSVSRGMAAWQGPAADAFSARWTTLSAYVEQGLAGRMADTAGYAEAVADWVSRTRLAVARTLAAIMTSAEAVTLRTGAEPGQVVRAAADIAARVLGAVADGYAQADLLLETWAGRLGELDFTPASAAAVSGALDVPL
jgi:hypothetical protein